MVEDSPGFYGNVPMLSAEDEEDGEGVAATSACSAPMSSKSKALTASSSKKGSKSSSKKGDASLLDDVAVETVPSPAKRPQTAAAADSGSEPAVMKKTGADAKTATAYGGVGVATTAGNATAGGGGDKTSKWLKTGGPAVDKDREREEAEAREEMEAVSKRVQEMGMVGGGG